MINRLMNRIIAALGSTELESSSAISPGSDKPGLKVSPPAAPAMSLLSFISVCKGLKPASTKGKNSSKSSVSSMSNGPAIQTVRERLIQIIYEANENNRAYYLEEKVK